MTKVQYTLKLNANNIGPLSCLNFNTNFDSSSPNVKIAIYAKNGSGKTMLSKTFNLTNKNETELASYNTSKLISKDSNNANFTFKLSPSSINNTLSINLIKNGLTTINNSSGYIFHVFNTEYIQENITSSHYIPNNKIEGYIIGKANIDLSQDELHLKQINDSIDSLQKEIQKKYNDSITTLNKLKIDKKTKEYKDYTLDSLMSDEQNNELPFEELKQHSMLSSLPDDINDVNSLSYVFNEDLVDIYSFLLKPYVKSDVVEDIRKYISDNYDFINKGLSLLDQDKGTCPFCKKHLDKDATFLVDTYLNFIQDEESKAISKITEYERLIDREELCLQKVLKDFSLIIKKFNELKAYFPTFADKTLTIIDDSPIINIFRDLRFALKEKLGDVTKTITLNTKKQLLDNYKKFYSVIESNNKLINEINKKKHKVNEEKLEINRHLCLSMKMQVKNEVKETKTKLVDLEQTASVLKKHITDQKNRIRKSKKDLVANDLKTYLSYFFGDKYKFDETNFSIVFKNQNINTEIEDVLSDGEKSIIAFCYYLASVHLIINQEDEYSKIFYIIDDPISSMDFSYVFCVSRLIDSFCRTTPSEKNPILVFTHNLEFMNIMIKNKLVQS